MPGVGSSIPARHAETISAPPNNHTSNAAKPEPTQARAVVDAFQALSLPPPTPDANDTAPTPTTMKAALHVRRTSRSRRNPGVPGVRGAAGRHTVSGIAAHFGIAPEYILANNAEIQDSDFLKLGQSVIIPAGNGILHEVRLGETLSDIADRYGVEVSAITAFASNEITAADDIKERQFLFVPGGKVPVAAPLPEPSAVPTAGDGTGGPAAEPTAAPSDGGGSSGGDGGGGSSGGGGIVRGGPTSGHGLIWPVVGPISSYYGPSHPLGIDIDGFNLAGAPIAAATSGTVVFAGGNACCSYGLYVVVMSPDGIETLYGHLSSISVSQGQTVAQGEELGIIGNTGYSTGRHLHFEVIDNGVRQNPLNYLP